MSWVCHIGEKNEQGTQKPPSWWFCWVWGGGGAGDLRRWGLLPKSPGKTYLRPMVHWEGHRRLGTFPQKSKHCAEEMALVWIGRFPMTVHLFYPKDTYVEWRTHLGDKPLAHAWAGPQLCERIARVHRPQLDTSSHGLHQGANRRHDFF